MSNRRKNAQNCWFFRRALSSFLSKNPHEWVHQSGFHLVLGTRMVFGNSNCLRFVQELMKHLMRQWMGINGETFLARSAPGKTRSDSCAKSPSKLSPALYKPCAKASAIPLKSRKMQIFSNFLSQSLARFRKSPYFCTRWRKKRGCPWVPRGSKSSLKRFHKPICREVQETG